MDTEVRTIQHQLRMTLQLDQKSYITYQEHWIRLSWAPTFHHCTSSALNGWAHDNSWQRHVTSAQNVEAPHDGHRETRWNTPKWPRTVHCTNVLISSGLHKNDAHHIYWGNRKHPKLENVQIWAEATMPGMLRCCKTTTPYCKNCVLCSSEACHISSVLRSKHQSWQGHSIAWCWLSQPSGKSAGGRFAV